MASVAQAVTGSGPSLDRLSGSTRASALDRWIYVLTAAGFVAIVLAGFIPDSLQKIGAVQAGHRPPFPLVMHLHAVFMGTFLALLLTQTVLVATGRVAWHRRLGLAAMILAPALVVVGFVLVPTNYHSLWHAAQAAPAPLKAEMQKTLHGLDNIMLLQTRIGILFSVLLFIGLRARTTDSGLHKRMMILATAVALPAGFDRIAWLPTTLPERPISPDLYVLLAILPMFLWDVIRNRTVHRAYWIWLGVALPVTVAVHLLWNTPGWHAAARRIMGV